MHDWLLPRIGDYFVESNLFMKKLLTEACKQGLMGKLTIVQYFTISMHDWLLPHIGDYFVKSMFFIKHHQKHPSKV